MKSWRSPVRVVKELVFGPDGPGTAQAVIAELQTVHAPLAGDMGRRVFGAKGTPALSFTGWVADPQSFRGAAQMGSTVTPPWAPGPALPATSPPPDYPTWVEDWQKEEGLVP